MAYSLATRNSSRCCFLGTGSELLACKFLAESLIDEVRRNHGVVGQRIASGGVCFLSGGVSGGVEDILRVLTSLIYNPRHTLWDGPPGHERAIGN